MIHFVQIMLIYLIQHTILMFALVGLARYPLREPWFKDTRNVLTVLSKFSECPRPAHFLRPVPSVVEPKRNLRGWAKDLRASFSFSKQPATTNRQRDKRSHNNILEYFTYTDKNLISECVVPAIPFFALLLSYRFLLCSL